jgi:glycine/D-amino acid oxidase-like deaminating enzyme
MGATVAFHLARSGAEVVVLDAAGPAGGTSSATFSADVSHLKTPESYHRLNRRGADLHRQLSAELEVDWRHPMPLIEWAGSDEDDARIRAKVNRLQSWGHPCHIEPASALTELVPGLAEGACGAEEIAVHKDAAWYDAPLFVRAMLDAAARHGANMRFGAPITSLIQSGNRVKGVVANGPRITADRVVNCAGPDAMKIAAMARGNLPLRRVPGLVGESTPLRTSKLSAILNTPFVDLRPGVDGRVVSVSWGLDARFRTATDANVGIAAVGAEIHRLAQAVYGPLRTTRSAGVRIGVRPVPSDGFPLVGEAATTPGLYTVVTHSGVTLAPLLGLLAADELMSGQLNPELAAYRPDRTPLANVLDESVRTMMSAGAP